MNIRWFGHETLLKKIKRLGKPMIMFDNDDLRRQHNDPLYDGLTYIFSRVHDSDGKTRPISKGAWFPWAVNTGLYQPVYGGIDIVMPCSIRGYPMRQRIATKYAADLNLRRESGSKYIKLLQQSRALIATGSDLCGVTRSKVLEAARCGCLIITQHTQYLERYFPLDMVLPFRKEKNVGKLIHRVKHMPMQEVKEAQQKLAEHAARYHDARIQAARMLYFIGELLAGRFREDLLEEIQNPLRCK